MTFFLKTRSCKKPIASRFFARVHPKRKSILLMLASLLPISAFAQEAPLIAVDLRSAVDLRTAIVKTISMHVELKSFINQTEVYAGYAQQAGVQSRPIISFSIEDALGTGEHSGFKSAQSTLSISWLLDGELVKRKMATAKRYGSTVALEREIKALDLAAQTARYFIQVLVNKERLKLAKINLKQANHSLKAVNKRVKAGKSSLVNKLKSQAEVAKRALEVEDLTHEVDASKFQLFAQWTQKNSGDFDNEQHKETKVIGSLLSLPLSDNSDFDSFSNKLFSKLTQTPSVNLFATKQRIAQSEIELARIETKPLWKFSTGLRRYETTDDFGLIAGISIPFGDSNQNEGKIRALRASKNQLETESLALVHKLNTQLYVLIEQIKHASHVIHAVTYKIIPVLEEAFIEAEKAYNVGRYSYTEWMNTQQELLNAQSDLIGAYQNAHLNNIEIERLTGMSLFTINKASNAPFNTPFNEKSNEK
ncbi:TolC family protein [Colwellia sp. TT2012]|uniref:TolC family protein n=1 Tax=Colwellia sp. TT2012 TaxID=1720342 RepID=UPI000A63B0AA|nr:TolC family protein [Colwellia sp. TT2012]